MDREKSDATRLAAAGTAAGSEIPGDAPPAAEQPDELKLDAGAGQGRGEEDIYALRAEPTPQPKAVPAPSRNFRDPRVVAEKVAEAEEQDREKSAWLAARHALPRELFFADTFNFPFRPHARVPFLLLLVGAVVMFATFGLAVSSASVEKTRAAAAGGASGSLGLMALGVVFALAWICVASVYGLAILRHTADGCDSVENLLSQCSAGDPLFVLGGLVIGMLPGLITAPLWDWLGWPKTLLVTITTILLFPMLLLSMLENNSPTQPVCPPVWQSVSVAWRAWGLFYFITLPTAVIVHLLTGLAMQYVGTAGALVAGPLLAAAWMLYFRLLGRLARFCSGRADA